jgi:hypothetical protein
MYFSSGVFIANNRGGSNRNQFCITFQRRASRRENITRYTILYVNTESIHRLERVGFCINP